MSQVKFQCQYQGKPAEVVAGYDRPLNYYHLTVFDLSIAEDDYESDECIYSDLNDAGCFSHKHVDDLKPILNELGIDPPPGFWELCEQKVGNVIWIYAGEEWIQTH